MEENTNNEQYLDLDEEQMQDVTGGRERRSFATDEANKAMLNHHQYMNEFDWHVSNGNYEAAKRTLNAADYQLKIANLYRDYAKQGL
jgi:hypothetical protein